MDVAVDCLGYIYDDKAVIEAVHGQVPFVLANEKSPAARCIFELVKSLLSGKEMASVSAGWRSFLYRLFGY